MNTWNFKDDLANPKNQQSLNAYLTRDDVIEILRINESSLTFKSILVRKNLHLDDSKVLFEGALFKGSKITFYNIDILFSNLLLNEYEENYSFLTRLEDNEALLDILKDAQLTFFDSIKTFSFFNDVALNYVLLLFETRSYFILQSLLSRHSTKRQKFYINVEESDHRYIKLKSEFETFIENYYNKSLSKLVSNLFFSMDLDSFGTVYEKQLKILHNKNIDHWTQKYVFDRILIKAYRLEDIRRIDIIKQFADNTNELVVASFLRYKFANKPYEAYNYLQDNNIPFLQSDEIKAALLILFPYNYDHKIILDFLKNNLKLVRFGDQDKKAFRACRIGFGHNQNSLQKILELCDFRLSIENKLDLIITNELHKSISHIIRRNGSEIKEEQFFKFVSSLYKIGFYNVTLLEKTFDYILETRYGYNKVIWFVKELQNILSEQDRKKSNILFLIPLSYPKVLERIDPHSYTNNKSILKLLIKKSPSIVEAEHHYQQYLKINTSNKPEQSVLENLISLSHKYDRVLAYFETIEKHYKPSVLAHSRLLGSIKLSKLKSKNSHTVAYYDERTRKQINNVTNRFSNNYLDQGHKFLMTDLFLQTLVSLKGHDKKIKELFTFLLHYKRFNEHEYLNMCRCAILNSISTSSRLTIFRIQRTFFDKKELPRIKPLLLVESIIGDISCYPTLLYILNRLNLKFTTLSFKLQTKIFECCASLKYFRDDFNEAEKFLNDFNKHNSSNYGNRTYISKLTTGEALKYLSSKNLLLDLSLFNVLVSNLQTKDDLEALNNLFEDNKHLNLNRKSKKSYLSSDLYQSQQQFKTLDSTNYNDLQKIFKSIKFEKRDTHWYLKMLLLVLPKHSKTKRYEELVLDYVVMSFKNYTVNHRIIFTFLKYYNFTEYKVLEFFIYNLVQKEFSIDAYYIISLLKYQLLKTDGGIKLWNEIERCGVSRRNNTASRYPFYSTNPYWSRLFDIYFKSKDNDTLFQFIESVDFDNRLIFVFSFRYMKAVRVKVSQFDFDHIKIFKTGEYFIGFFAKNHNQYIQSISLYKGRS